LTAKILESIKWATICIPLSISTGAQAVSAEGQHQGGKSVEPSIPFSFQIERAPDENGLCVKLRFSNRSSSTIVLNVRNAVGETRTLGQLPKALREVHLHELEFVVAEEGGEPLEFMVDVKQRALAKSDFKQLAPDQVFEEAICLSTYFDFREDTPYQVQCAYMNGESFGVGAWTGLVLSNILHHVIVGRQGM